MPLPMRLFVAAVDRSDVDFDMPVIHNAFSGLICLMLLDPGDFERPEHNMVFQEGVIIPLVKRNVFRGIG